MSNLKLQNICLPITRYLGNDAGIQASIIASTKWEIGSKIGDPSEASAYGQVWQACEYGKCAYVLKFIPIGSPKSGIDLPPKTKEDIIHEFDIHSKISKLGMAPKIMDSWLCGEKGGVIIMKTLKQTVNSLIRSYSSTKVKNMIIGACVGLITKLHLKGYYHGDTHLKNIMVDYKESDAIEADEEVDEVEKYKMTNYKYYFIDLERAGSLNNLSFEETGDSIKDYEILAMDLNYIMADNEKFNDLDNILELISHMIKSMR